MESRTFQMILLVSLFYALVFDDYSIIVCGVQLNNIFDGVTFFVMIVFLIELVISSFFMRDYLGSYYFYLDTVSMLSLITDLNLVQVILNTVE